MEHSFRGADIVYPKSWTPFGVMQRRTPLLQKGDRHGLQALEKECLATNARFKNWECDEKKIKLTRGGQQVALTGRFHAILPGKISGQLGGHPWLSGGIVP